jgi:hypothetical protein
MAAPNPVVLKKRDRDEYFVGPDSPSLWGSFERARQFRNVNAARSFMKVSFTPTTQAGIEVQIVAPPTPGPGPGEPPVAFRLPESGVDVDDVERSFVVQALERSGGNQTQAATLLGMKRDQIRYRMEKYELMKRGRRFDERHRFNAAMRTSSVALDPEPPPTVETACALCSKPLEPDDLAIRFWKWGDEEPTERLGHLGCAVVAALRSPR